MVEYPTLTSAVEPLAFGEAVVSGAWLGDTPAFALADGTIAFGDGVEARRAAPHPGAAILVAASDGRRFVTGGDDGRVVGTDADGEIETIADEKGKWIDALALHEGAVAWSAGKAVRARPAKGEVKSLDLPSTCRGLAFFPQGLPPRRGALQRRDAVVSQRRQARSPQLERLASRCDDFAGRTLPRHLHAGKYPARLARRRRQTHAHGGLSGKDAQLLLVLRRQMARDLGRRRSASSGPSPARTGRWASSPANAAWRSVMVTRVAFHPGALVVAIGFEDGLVMLAAHFRRLGNIGAPPVRGQPKRPNHDARMGRARRAAALWRGEWRGGDADAAESLSSAAQATVHRT